MAISTADFRNGMCIEYNNKLCTIVEFQHVKPGKGGAFVRTKLRDIKTGRVVDYTFNAGTKFDSVRLETKKMQFLYSDGTDFNFMDMSSFEQLSIPAETVGSAANWLRIVRATRFEEEVRNTWESFRSWTPPFATASRASGQLVCLSAICSRSYLRWIA